MSCPAQSGVGQKESLSLRIVGDGFLGDVLHAVVQRLVADGGGAAGLPGPSGGAGGQRPSDAALRPDVPQVPLPRSADELLTGLHRTRQHRRTLPHLQLCWEVSLLAKKPHLAQLSAGGGPPGPVRDRQWDPELPSGLFPLCRSRRSV